MTYRAGIEIRPARRHLMYATLSRGFESGGFQEAPSTAAGAIEPFPFRLIECTPGVAPDRVLAMTEATYEEGGGSGGMNASRVLAAAFRRSAFGLAMHPDRKRG